MKPDDKTERIKPVEDREENPSIERERESEAAEVQEPQPTGWAAQLRQIMHRPAQGEARTNIKRQQLREDRTKSFLLLAGLTVVLALAFFVMFSTPSTGRKEIVRTNQPNLGRGSGGENTDTSHSVTPLLNADTRNPDDNAGNLSAQDIRNTAKQRMLAQASPSFGDAPVPPPPAPRPEPKDYALNRIQFPPEQPQTTTPIPAPKVEKLTKASLVFVSSGAGPRVTAQTSSGVQPVVLERNPEFMAPPTGTRLIARLQTPVSSAVKTPVVAAIEYNYERDGEIVIPAGSKAFGELSQVNDQGYVGIQFHTIQMPDETTQKIEGHAVGLQYQPLRGQVTGRNTEQLAEAGLYLFVIAAAVIAPVLRKFTTRGKRNKRPPFVIPARKDERAIESAWNQNAVLLGYDMDETPWLWPDEVRVMQGIVLGMTGSGKTTLLKNIITQDSARFVGPPEDRHHIPMVIFDGKGDLEFFEQLLPHIHRAGRLHQLRLLNPSRPEFSALYNPFFTHDDNYMAQVNMIFGSFNLHDEFFAKHQLNYLGDIVRVLFYTGARYNFYDVIVMLLDQDVLKEQIDKAIHRLDRDSNVTAQQRLNFEMSVKNLTQSLEDRERVPKIQGLINECMTFLDDELSAVTGQYDDLLSIEDVIDQELILFVSLNSNKNIEPVRSLGKMLLQNIQLTVGKRYEDKADRRRQNRPIFSVVLDEFAPFGYRNFAQILQTARGTNTAFLFSMQSLPQLMQVGRGFKEEVTSAPNTTITLRTRDEETAEYFIKASAEQVVTRRSVQKERGFFGFGKYEETGRATESENRETRSQDESIKNLPKGQMEILMSEDTRGTLHSQLQVRPPEEVAIPGFQPALYPRMLHSRAESSGANLRFKDPDLARKYRVPSRQVGGFRK